MCLKKINLIIASSSLDEAITQCVLNHKNSFDLNINIILINELLTDFEICDELTDEASIIRWFKPHQETFSNQTHYLLNRTLCVDKPLFSNFKKADREYAKREFEAYLGYSFSSYKGVGNQTVNGLCDTFYALPEQWIKIKKTTNLNTPEYYWGPKSHHKPREVDALVYSDIYNLLNWSISAPKPNNPHVFCFKKPQGQPLFVLSIGEKILITSKIKHTRALEIKLTQILKHIQACFGYFIFETLLFIEDNLSISFGCVNLELIQTPKHPDFSAFVCQNLFREYLKCVH